MKTRSTIVVVLLLACPLAVRAQEETQARAGAETETEKPSFETVARSVEEELREANEELRDLRDRIADERLPLSRQLGKLESELLDVRQEYHETSRMVDLRTQDVYNLESEIKKRRDELEYLSGLLADYIRNFEARLHIAEKHLYDEELEEARLAPDDSNLSEEEVYRTQAGLLGVSLDRLHEALGGRKFQGSALDADRLMKEGTFLMIGPCAVFRSAGGETAGTVEQKLGSMEPTAVPFGEPKDRVAALEAVRAGRGELPIDPTLGNAHEVEQMDETLWEHVEKGGVVMIPIFALAAAALIVALFKWVGLSLTRNPSRKKVDALLEAVRDRDEQAARERVAAIRGPAGRMLEAGVDHIREPRELVEEVMYENVLTTRLEVQRFLPFIAICAASAPLLGLLGTVTGIINTFKLITLHGTGDVSTLSGGISEALITTKFGLIVAIPSLLFHAFLARKARSVVGNMEKTAVVFLNQVSKAMGPRDRGRSVPDGVDPDLVRSQVREVLDEVLVPALHKSLGEGSGTSGGSGSDSSDKGDSKKQSNAVWVDHVHGGGSSAP